MSEPVQAHVYVSGTVQGVYYRASTKEQADQRSVNGWVKNLADGRVEAIFEGNEAAVNELVEWCHNGPKRASVTDVDVEYTTPEGFEDFQIKR